MMADLKRTPLFEVYKKHGAKVVEFAGWELPVQFSGIKDEHLAVRERAGIFDVSHMGEIRIAGPGALEFIQAATPNDLQKIKKGGSQYSAFLNPEGGIIDDIFIYRLGDDDFMICVNAANADQDFEWLTGLPRSDCELINQSGEWAQLAVQGPCAPEIAARVLGGGVSAVRRFQAAALEFEGQKLWAARTGYTGEDGFELFAPPGLAVRLWESLLAAGRDCGLVPCGLGSRDTLRLEMGYPLHGHDISPDITPHEAGLSWIVSDTKDFVGREALERQMREGLKKKRTGLVMEEPGIARDGCRIIAPHGEGKVTSGTKTPSLENPVALGYVPAEDAAPGNLVEVEIRGRLKKARTAGWPFYKVKKF